MIGRGSIGCGVNPSSGLKGGVSNQLAPARLTGILRLRTHLAVMLEADYRSRTSLAYVGTLPAKGRGKGLPVSRIRRTERARKDG